MMRRTLLEQFLQRFGRRQLAATATSRRRNALRAGASASAATNEATPATKLLRASISPISAEYDGS
jgi:hypothetical protein